MGRSWASWGLLGAVVAVGAACSGKESRPPVLSTTGDAAAVFDAAPAVDAPADTPATDAGASASPRCTTDNVAGLAATGAIAVGPADDLVALCDGTVLIGDRRANEVVERHVTRGVGRRFALSAAPGAMALDAAGGLLYVTLSAASSLARINLETGAVSTIALPGVARDVVVGNGGRAFALLGTADAGMNPVVVIDGASGTAARTIPLGSDGFGAGFLGHDGPGNQLLVGVAGLSPSTLSRFAFDADAGTLTLSQSTRAVGSNGQDLAVSPDGTRVAFACGGGNGVGYTIFDIDSRDLTMSRGEWNTGAYPRAAAFSLDGTRLLATNGGALVLFNAATHAEIVRQDPPSSPACSPDLDQRVAISRGGRLGFLYADCGTDEASGRLTWRVLPE